MHQFCLPSDFRFTLRCKSYCGTIVAIAMFWEGYLNFFFMFLLCRDPALWRSAILYYTVHKASLMSFTDLFKDLAQFVQNPEVRWDYCLRSKRGQYDTSKPGKLGFSTILSQKYWTANWFEK